MRANGTGQSSGVALERDAETHRQIVSENFAGIVHCEFDVGDAEVAEWKRVELLD